MNMGTRLFALAAIALATAFVAESAACGAYDETKAVESRSTGDVELVMGRGVEENRTDAGRMDARTEQDRRYDLRLNLAGMDALAGQSIYLRVIDTDGEHTVYRDSIRVTDANPTWSAPGILRNDKSYEIDLFADVNGNKRYDKREDQVGDPAWSIDIGDVENRGKVVMFRYTTDYDDIEWPHEAVVRFDDVGQYSGREFHARLREAGTGKVVGENAVVVENDKSMIALDGIEPGRDYYIDLYADVNRTGRFEGPPADRAWRLNVTDAGEEPTFTFDETRWQRIGERDLNAEDKDYLEDIFNADDDDNDATPVERRRREGVGE